MTADLPPPFVCEAPRPVDGDTLRCLGRAPLVRLAGIDAPELSACRRGRSCVTGDAAAAAGALAMLLARGPVSCRPVDIDRYGRTVARCATPAAGDLSCALVAAGHAVRRYRPIACPGDAR